MPAKHNNDTDISVTRSDTSLSAVAVTRSFSRYLWVTITMCWRKMTNSYIDYLKFTTNEKLEQL